MKSKSKTSILFKVIGCLMFSIALMFGAMFSGNSKVVFAAESDAQKTNYCFGCWHCNRQ